GASRPFLFGESSSGNSAPRRARAVVRRYAVANNLRVFVSARFASDVSEDEARSEARAYLARLRAKAFDGSTFPYIVVPEENCEVTGWHDHVLLPPVPLSVATGEWVTGDIQVELLRSTDDIRNVAVYVSKTFSLPSKPGRHR